MSKHKKNSEQQMKLLDYNVKTEIIIRDITRKDGKPITEIEQAWVEHSNESDPLGFATSIAIAIIGRPCLILDSQK